METLTLLLLSILPGLAIAAGLKDLTSMTIPNWISVALVVGFFPAALATGLTPLQVAAHLGVGLVALVLGMALFALRWIGGGDAKLMAAACLWLGLSGSAVFLLWTAVAGGLFSLILMGARAQAQLLPASGPAWLSRLLQPKADIPYGVAIAVGALIAFPESGLMTAFVGR